MINYKIDYMTDDKIILLFMYGLAIIIFFAMMYCLVLLYYIS